MDVRLAARGLRKAFGNLVVTDDVSLEARGGEALGIIGPNGAGKTTLFHLLGGSLTPDAGSVYLDGVDVSREPPQRRCRRGLARTHQIPRPFVDLSVYENALVGAGFGHRHAAPRAPERAMQALERAGIAELADRPAASLGLLARKRLELARALAAEPSVLLLDEVAGGLTEAETAELCKVLDEIRRAGVALVWVEHGVTSLAGFVDRLLALDRGHVVAVGRPDEVLADPAVQVTYFGDEASPYRRVAPEPSSASTGAVPEPLLRVDGLAAFYGQLQAVRGVSFGVEAGAALAVIGENGAGKTTLLHSICGLHAAAAGRVVFDGEELRGVPAHDIVRRGIALVPEGRRIFPSLSVDENLRVAEDQGGREPPSASRPRRWTRDGVYELFPDLRAAAGRGGHQISGGQQQMLAIGRALLSEPRLLLLDEVSLGLSPAVVNILYGALAAIRAEGVTLVFVEQDVRRSMAFADHLVCLHKGTVRLAGRSLAHTLDEVRRAYFG